MSDTKLTELRQQAEGQYKDLCDQMITDHSIMVIQSIPYYGLSHSKIMSMIAQGE